MRYLYPNSPAPAFPILIFSGFFLLFGFNICIISALFKYLDLFNAKNSSLSSLGTALNIAFRKNVDFCPVNEFMDRFENSETNRIRDFEGLLRTLGVGARINLTPIVRDLTMLSASGIQKPDFVLVVDEIEQKGFLMIVDLAHRDPRL